MKSMKVSVSIPDEDVAFLDAYVRNHRVRSRSSALRRAIRLLRASELNSDYAGAFAEWDDDPDSEAWDTVAGDGLTSRR